MPRDRNGFTLVEVMVGMVIGMIGIIIMMQVFSFSEGQKRTTTGSGDSQSNGAMAVYNLQRDIRQAGFGFNSTRVLGCGLKRPAQGSIAAHDFSFLAPVVINPPTTDVPAGDANTDTLLIMYGNSDGTPEGDLITLLNGNTLGIITPANFQSGQWVFQAPAAAVSPCSLNMTTVSSITGNFVTVAETAVNANATHSLFAFGSTPRILAYAIRGGNLTVCNYMTADCSAACTATDGTCSTDWIPIANDIVSLRAQYGRDTSSSMDGIDTWDQTTPSATGLSADQFACLWVRASALRIAVVARNAQPEKGEISGPNAPLWQGSAGAAIDLSAKANWRNYRYKVFETTIPIRNLPWMASCT